MFEGNTIYEKMVKTFQEGGTEKMPTELKKNIESYKKSVADLKEEHKRIIRVLVKGTITDEDVKDEFLKWFNENGRHYTPEMVSKTYQKLKEYYS